MIYAKYDLSRWPTTFDFASWLVLAKTAGCDHVQFVIGNGVAEWKYPKTVTWKRFGNILVPMCALAGMDFSVVHESDGFEFPYAWGDVEKLYQKNKHVELLKPTFTLKPAQYVTITMRDSFRNTHRNSDVHEWEKFRGYLERRGKRVVQLEECERSPLDLEYRLALYAGAEMNFGVNNGPMSMCAMSEAPYMIFNIYPKRKATEKTYDLVMLMESTGFGEGSQFGFRNERQTLVWGPDDYEVMVNAYETMFDEKRAAA